MKKIPYGISNYKVLQEEGYLYVDKTMYLNNLEDVGKTLMYLRPGRFGKSLFTSMMYYYYDINSECLFDSLFKDTYVFNNPTKNKNNYYILKLDFSGITSVNMSYENLEFEFNEKIKDGILNFLITYDFENKLELNNKSSNTMLIEFLRYFKSLNQEHKIYIIIDEYDNFTNGILEGDATLFKTVVSTNGFVKSFYAIIKEYIGLGVVDRFFATGICPITLNSMTTGFNISTDLSTDIEFASMIGLTHEEVKTLIKEYNNKEEIYEVMIENYDGYLFSDELEDENRTFNATLVMYFLREYERFNKIPNILYDNNIVVNYDKIENLIKLQNNEFWQELINEILTTQEVSGNFRTSFNLNVSFDRDDIISLLYYFGYLTIKESGIGSELVFRVPNEMMRITYNNYLLKLLKEIGVMDSEKRTNALKEIIYEGTINNISNYISEILKLSDNRIFMKFDEKYIQALYFGLLVGVKEYSIYSEYPCSNGYIDIMILSKCEEMKNDIMIELKYIKKSEYTSEVLNNKKIEGIAQLKKYSEDERINKKIVKYLVIYVGNELKVLESL